MKIVLVATDSTGKNLGFISDSMKVLSLENVLTSIRSGDIEGVHLVQSRHGKYVRSAPNTSEKDNLDAISISGRDIIFYAQGISRSIIISAIVSYLKRYVASLKEGQPFLKPSQHFFKVLIIDVKSKFTPHTSLIKTVAKEFSVDKYLLGAIIIDEIARLLPFEEILELLGGKIVGINVSIGVAQVQIDTANLLIKGDIYNPNPADRKLPFSGTLSNTNRMHLYEYLIQPKHNIRFAAARMRDLINEWLKFVDLSQKPEIVATLYHRTYVAPHSKPEPNERGAQIASEFYKLSKKWLD